MLVRTWNLFHGRTVPPSGALHLEEMVRLSTEDEPAVLLLQEVPPWAFRYLGGWAGMTVFTEVAARAPLGARLGRKITEIDPVRLRRAASGQGNAILLDPALEPFDYHALVLNPLGFRRGQKLPLRLQLAWAKERRVLQAIRVKLPDGRRMLIGNLHATGNAALARLELRRAREFFLALARPGEVEVLGGDFNVRADALGAFVNDDFSGPGSSVDHVLVRGASASTPEVWPEDRRRLSGELLSDHAPLEVRIS